MIAREKLKEVKDALARQAAVALIGPRQVGKTTLARIIGADRNAVYLDLESPVDKAKLADPVTFFNAHADRLIILDEIQRLPDIFQILRGVIDEDRWQGKPTGRFLVLGSASLDLLKQSSESLAGRISYIELAPLSITEIPQANRAENQLLLRGGFPPSYLAKNEKDSIAWRQDFISTYLERDIPLFGPRVPAEALRRFWTMLAHNQGQSLQGARLAGALGVSAMTISRYLDLLVDLLLVRQLKPWMSNSGKRLVRSPKVYVRDSGLVHALLNITSYDDLLGHPVAGASYEGFVIENILTHLPFGADFGFYRTAIGAEIDLIISLPTGSLWAIEIKRSLVPKLERGFYHASEDLKPKKSFVVYPGEDSFSLGNGITAISLLALIDKLKGLA